jgi:hypothetical protein
MRRLAGAGVVFAITVGLSVWAGSQRANAAPAHVSGPWLLASTLRSSRLVVHGRVRCTVTVRSTVDVGQPVSVKFVLHNVSKHTATFSTWVGDADVALRAADGTSYDWGERFAGLPGIPPPIPTKIPAGATKLLGRIAIPVRWSGPLQVTPECLGKPLPVLRVRVESPWPPPDESVAVDEVVAAAGHLLDHCRPQAPGVPVDGEIDPPSGSAAPLNAACSISLDWEGDFLVAQALVLTPPGLSGVQIYQPYETLWPSGSLVGLTSSPPYEAIAWEFVVTADGALPVAAATTEASCGATAFAWGTYPSVEFISACSS